MLEKLLDRFREKGPSRPRTKTETEKRRRLVIVLLIVVAVLSSVAIVGYGYYDTNIRPWNRRILKVNGTVIEMRAFVYALRLQQSYSQYYSSQAEWAQAVAGSLEQNELARQRLAEFGVDVRDVTSNEAVDAKLREHLVSYGFTSDNATDGEYQEGLKSFKKALKDALELPLGDYEKLAIEPELISAELQRRIGDRDYPEGSSLEHAQVQALLVTGADEATQLRAKWEAGEAFDTLAEEQSVSESLRGTDSDNTSTTEWMAKGIKNAAFDDFAFSATPGVLSDPIQDSDSTGSYWLIRVVARESRALSESDRDTLVGEAYSEWLEEATDPEKNDIVNYLDKEGGESKLNWALDHVTVSPN
jgi:parvulin-like peptidyl-prolyl isomerase